MGDAKEDPTKKTEKKWVELWRKNPEIMGGNFMPRRLTAEIGQPNPSALPITGIIDNWLLLVKVNFSIWALGDLKVDV